MGLRRINRVRVSVMCAAVACSSLARVRAAETTFSIDPAQSALTLSGSAFANMGDPLAFGPQAPGSLTAALSGDLVADITVGSIAVTGGTWMLANTGDWLPGGTAANFGLQADAQNPLIGAMTGAVRDAALTPAAPAIGTSPSANGFTFSADGLSLTGLSGQLDLDGGPEGSVLGALAGVSVPLTGIASTSTIQPVPAGTYTNIAGVETLTLPVHVLYAGNLPGQDLEWQFAGTVVATRIPEPASALLMLAGGAMVPARVRRHR